MNGFKGTPNRNGRKLGSKNRANLKIKEAFSQIVQDNVEQLINDIKSLTAKDRVNAILTMAKFIVPSLKAVEMDATVDNEVNNSELIERLLKIDDATFNNLENE